jgi:hypothetical protein
MQTSSTDSFIIFSVSRKDAAKVRAFLLELQEQESSGELGEVLSHWRDGILDDDEGVHQLNLSGPQFIIIFGKEFVHIILERNEEFERGKELFLRFVPFSGA